MGEHIHLAVTIGLRFRGIDVLTVQEDERTGISDSLIFDGATKLQRIVFSQDQDLVEANRRQIEGIDFPGIIYAHQRLVTIGKCIRDLEIIAKASNQRIFLTAFNICLCDLLKPGATGLLQLSDL